MSVGNADGGGPEKGKPLPDGGGRSDPDGKPPDGLTVPEGASVGTARAALEAGSVGTIDAGVPDGGGPEKGRLPEGAKFEPDRRPDGMALGWPDGIGPEGFARMEDCAVALLSKAARKTEVKYCMLDVALALT